MPKYWGGNYFQGLRVAHFIKLPPPKVWWKIYIHIYIYNIWFWVGGECHGIISQHFNLWSLSLYSILRPKLLFGSTWNVIILVLIVLDGKGNFKTCPNSQKRADYPETWVDCQGFWEFGQVLKLPLLSNTISTNIMTF